MCVPSSSRGVNTRASGESFEVAPSALGQLDVEMMLYGVHRWNVSGMLLCLHDAEAILKLGTCRLYEWLFNLEIFSVLLQ